MSPLRLKSSGKNNEPTHVGCYDKQAVLSWFIERLAHFYKNLIITVMKLALAVLVYVLMGVVLGAGILLTVAGKPWFLIAAIIAYVVAFGKIGCMTH